MNTNKLDEALVRVDANVDPRPTARSEVSRAIREGIRQLAQQPADRGVALVFDSKEAAEAARVRAFALQAGPKEIRTTVLQDNDLWSLILYRGKKWEEYANA